MKLLFCLAAVVVLTNAVPDPFNQEEGKCGCCPMPCCCTCVPTVEVKGKTCPPIASTTPFVPECKSTLDVTVVLDSSGSIGTENWPIALQFVRDILKAFPTIGIEGTRVALARYSSNASKDWDFCGPETNNGQAALMDALQPSNLELMGQLTNSPAALEVVLNEILTAAGCDRPDTENIVMVITDGRTNFRKGELPGLSAALHAKAKCVVAVGITTAIDMNELNIISNCNGEDVVLTVTDFDQLNDLLVRLVTEVCTEPVESTPPPPCVPEESKLEEECFCCCPPPSGYNGYVRDRCSKC